MKEQSSGVLVSLTIMDMNLMSPDTLISLKDDIYGLYDNFIKLIEIIHNEQKENKNGTQN